ncbi:hypothetical protein DL769_005878 [Monosporascus sp. CRB-8-3]|nr:hypothetical protein DL769_005878 [Monosporascus sp. CRB-8-3]
MDLQSRIYNHLQQGLGVFVQDRRRADREEAGNEGGKESEDYTPPYNRRGNLVVFHTAFAIGQYFSWTYILRRQVQFLRFSTEENNKKLSDILDTIGHIFLTDKYRPGQDDRFMIWRPEQMAMGEIMTVPQDGDGEELFCMGYSEFYSKFQNTGGEDKDFQRWFRPIVKDIEWLSKPSQSGKDTRRLSSSPGPAH